MSCTAPALKAVPGDQSLARNGWGVLRTHYHRAAVSPL